MLHRYCWSWCSRAAASPVVYPCGIDTGGVMVGAAAAVGGVFADVIEAQHRIEDPAIAALLVQAIAARFFVMFLAGAFLYQFRTRFPLDGRSWSC